MRPSHSQLAAPEHVMGARDAGTPNRRTHAREVFVVDRVALESVNGGQRQGGVERRA